MATGTITSPTDEEKAAKKVAYERRLDSIINQATGRGFANYAHFQECVTAAANKEWVTFGQFVTDLKVRVQSDAYTDEIRASIAHDDVRLKMGLAPIGSK